ncbi:MAG: sigma-54-dependent Fis family transcriptional regulator [Muribaculaceae bacterium]|nr:sigma-54-dependent Fis family transcriptional regulator [Muribaculaceae bacterium]
MAKITDNDIRTTMQRYGIIGSAPALINAVKRALIIAPIDISVLINGENGTGKEFFPKIIHDNSPRKHKKYIAVNCGAIPAGTISSELFGHEKGSFTNAEKEHAGYFEVANGGTIFLDEVADLTLDAQARLLRVLESGEYLRVGSSEVRKTNVRVVAATNKDLLQMVNAGEFREDLFYRIAAIRIEVPPLRERGEDIKMLATKFCYDYAEQHHRPPLMFDESAYRQLMSFSWSGNVRELQSLIREMSSFESGVVTGEVVKKYLNQKNHSGNLPVVYDKVQHDYTQERELIFKLIMQMQSELKELKETVANANIASKQQGNKLHLSSNINELQRQSSRLTTINNDDDLVWQNVAEDFDIDEAPRNQQSRHSFSDIKATAIDVEEDKIKTLEDTEREVIINAIERNHGRRRQTAEELGISERTLYRKIKEYGLEYRNNRK